MMQMDEMDVRRALRDITKHVERSNSVRNPIRSMELLREFGLCNATIGIALGLTEGVVACWNTGTKPCPSERKAELDMLLRQVCSLAMRKHDELPEKAWTIIGPTYFKALAYLDKECAVTPEERAMLSNAAPRLGVFNG